MSDDSADDRNTAWANAPAGLAKPVLSFTQLELYLACPRKYRLRYVDGIKLPASGAMILGRAWHQGIERNYRQKIRTGADLPTAEVVEFTTEAARAALTRGIDDGSVVLAPWERLPKLLDVVAEAAAVHHREIAPGVQPVIVEERWRLVLPGFAFDLVGVWDCVDTDNVVIDNKLIGTVPDQESFDRALQWTIYALAWRAIRGEVEHAVRMDAVGKKPRVHAKQLWSRRTNAQCRWALRLIEEVGTAILAGSFPPNPMGEYCAPAWCGHWNRCQGMTGQATSTTSAAGATKGDDER